MRLRLFDGTDYYDKLAYGSLWGHLEGTIGQDMLS